VDKLARLVYRQKWRIATDSPGVRTVSSQTAKDVSSPRFSLQNAELITMLIKALTFFLLLSPRSYTIHRNFPKRFKSTPANDIGKPRPTEVVKLRRSGGQLVQGCDVYIGRAINQGGWNLPCSKWHNPFRRTNDTFEAKKEAVAKLKSTFCVLLISSAICTSCEARRWDVGARLTRTCPVTEMCLSVLRMVVRRRGACTMFVYCSWSSNILPIKVALQRVYNREKVKWKSLEANLG
jgi:hypothetical protein